MSVPDDNALVEGVEALQLEGPRGSSWCMDCNSPVAAQCMNDHGVVRPQTALRLGLHDVVPRASQALQELPDGAALTALRLLHGQPTTCKLTLRQDDGETFDAEWRVDGQGAEDSLAQTLSVMTLAASGRLVQEPSEVHADAPPAAQQPADDRIPELNLRSLSQSDPDARREDKAEKLRLVQQRGVRKITWLYCDSDPDWALDVLRSAASTLEELQVVNPSKAHLAVVHGMQRLQRLHLDADRGGVPDNMELTALTWPSCLKWLRVRGLSRATTVSLLRAHAASLDVLWLGLGSDGDGVWPNRCADLDALLGQCRLRGLRLKRLVLWRSDRVHSGSPCRAQLDAARRTVEECTVRCEKCDCVTNEGL